MSNSIPPNFIKAASGDYHIPIKTIFFEAWYRVKGMKASFWGGFLYFIAAMTVVCMVLGLLLALYDMYVLPSATAHNITSFLYNLKLGLKFIFVGIVEILRFLFTTSFVYLALTHLRGQPVHASMAFSFRQAWHSLLIIALLFYLFNIFLISIADIFLHSALFKQQIAYLSTTLSVVPLLAFLFCVFLYFYFSIILFMATLLILDQKIVWKESLILAFHAVSQHFLKNISLIILTSVVFGFLAVVTLGIGLIWLLPMTSLVIAIQYNQIFCEGSLV